MFVVRTADEIERAVLLQLGREKIHLRIFGERLHLGRVDADGLKAERPQREKMAIAIAPDARGLIDNFALFARDPMWCGIHGIAFRNLAHARLAFEHYAD